MSLTTYGTKIDLRPLRPGERHALTFNTFRSLGASESMELINDHDTRPLQEQFQAQLPGRFSWEYLESGPAWRVRITKLAIEEGSRQCCGACGGA
ncbi:MAG: aminotransferase [Roseateles depolymerans]|uniref:Aminotransferase n=1 Tax=Roseateles depolymerans TaxID=76731 RepID=A0A2W5DIG2_9BURK|nr:MAG: aminotransferase [Roseateles depolymerans]